MTLEQYLGKHPSHERGHNGLVYIYWPKPELWGLTDYLVVSATGALAILREHVRARISQTPEHLADGTAVPWLVEYTHPKLGHCKEHYAFEIDARRRAAELNGGRA